MSTFVSLSGLTINAEEARQFSEIIAAKMFSNPDLSKIASIMTGVKMKQQMVFGGSLGLTGIADSGCTRPAGGATVTPSEKFAEPVAVGDTFTFCQKDFDTKFKMSKDKIKTFIDLYEIYGTDSEAKAFLLMYILEAAERAFHRYVWLGDTDAAAATTTVAGLKASGNVKFYSPVDGIWKSIFDAHTAAPTSMKRVTINENSQTTTALQETLAEGRASEIFAAMWKIADPRLQSQPNKQILVSGELYDNYEQELSKASREFTLDYTINGFPALRWKGCDVIDMRTVWDTFLKADWEDNTVNAAYYLPNRAILTVPENLLVTTLNDGDISNVESFYEKKDRLFYNAYGFTVHAFHAEDLLTVGAW